MSTIVRMPSIPNFNGLNGLDAAAAGGASPPAYLTPDAILAYCSSRLQNLDGQVQKLMSQQQGNVDAQQGLATVMDDLTKLQSKSDGSATTDMNGASKLETDLEQVISKMETQDPSNPQLAQLKQLHDTIAASGAGPSNGHGYYSTSSNRALGAPPNGQAIPSDVPNNSEDGKFSNDEMNDYSNQLKNITNGLSSGAELGMIQIQSLMSQRSTAIQLSTNILQAVDDGTAKIVSNVGH